MSERAGTPEPPYYAVIFTSQRRQGDKGYEETAKAMVESVSRQKGFLGSESARDADGFGITVSYWASPESIEGWKRDVAHQAAKNKGRELWYEGYAIRFCLVQKASFFEAGSQGGDRGLPPH
ncbi:MAG TPA: antibiotic biosynthesis monooxygenase [Rectinemataceae bacterium]|nr:antibiotic biosynthesis monooxygenase [Rectinemataceae bacterium]